VWATPDRTRSISRWSRGEVDVPSLFYNTLNATRPNWRAEKNIKLLLQYGLEKEPALANVPSLLDLVTNPEIGCCCRRLGRDHAGPALF